MDPDQHPDAGAETDTEQVTDSDRAKNRNFLIIGGVILIGVVALLSVFAGGGSGTGSGDEPESASAINDLVFTNEDGSTGTLADFEGEPVVVNFFASWCAPCRAELPDFRDVNLEVGDKVQFVGISHDIDQSSWLSLINEFELSYPTGFQPEQEIWEELNLFGMPSTAFITADGEVAHTFSGVLNQASLKDLIAEHLDVEV